MQSAFPATRETLLEQRNKGSCPLCELIVTFTSRLPATRERDGQKALYVVQGQKQKTSGLRSDSFWSFQAFRMESSWEHLAGDRDRYQGLKEGSTIHFRSLRRP